MLPPLRHFSPKEFKNPDRIDPDAAKFLDEVRERFGFLLIVTDDARLPGDHPSGASPTSLHYVGRAFDLRWIQPAVRLARFVESVITVAGEWGVDYELELVNSTKDQHIHLGLQRPGVASELIVAGD